MKTIKNNLFLIRNFKHSDINKKFISGLNNKKLNKFISTRKKKQSYKEALKYYEYTKKNKIFYLAVIDNKNDNLIGTITYKKHNRDTYFLGYMVNDLEYIGGLKFFKAVKLSINHLFKTFKIKNFLAATEKKNLSSSFFLIKLRFDIMDSIKKTFKFLKIVK
jgi:hypothetical protein